MIRLAGAGKRYPDGTVAVHDLDLTVARGELVALVGPSGCGKSTTLRMVNRLVEPTAGKIFVDGTDVTTTNAVKLRRRIGYVIQRVGLFPHQTVRQNVATVPRLLGWDDARTTERVDRLLTLVGLDPAVYGPRYPQALSGGQQQRVGVARALAADPPVLLMDEPFGAVDPQQRDRLQTEFRALQQELGTTVLFVTHDIDEAVRLADRIAVFGQGVIEQVATPGELLAAPRNEQVASFVGADRNLRRMSVVRLGREHIVPGGGSRPADNNRVLELGVSLREAFLALLASERNAIAVVDPKDGGRRVGTLTPETFLSALRSTARE